jgi:xylan 1,4-beta-xylosidase
VVNRVNSVARIVYASGMSGRFLHLVAAAAFLAACSAPPPPPPPPAPKPAPAVAQFDWFAYEGHDPVYDTVKAGPGDYLNPILPGFYPDPSILRVGEDYYLVNSTFAFFPGLPVFHSRDMVHWAQIGNAIDRPSQVDFGKLEMSRALFAPAISYHDGTFAIVNTCVDCVEDLKENFLITAANPAGPWSDPIVLGFEGIDPSLFFDRDGKAYVVNNGPPDGTPLYNGHRAIWMQEIDWATKKMTGPRRVIVNGGSDIRQKPIWVEGPHLFRARGWYYLICAEGGTAEQHSEVVFRSKKVWGPYVPYKGNPILTQRDLDPARPFPVTSTGHAQFVATPRGQWWAVFLGTRPYAGDSYNTGRETFLLPVHWTKGWPVILPKGKPVPYTAKRPALPIDPAPLESGNFATRDEFDGTALGPQWLFIRTPHERWHSLSQSSLVLQARPVAIGNDGQPSFVGRRQQHGWASASTAMHFAPKIDGERAGLVAFQNSNYFYFLGLVRENGKTQVCVTKRAGSADPENGTALICAPAPEGPLSLKIEARGGAYDFYYGSAPDQWTVLLRDADGTILSTKTAGGFVGTIIGMYAYTPP